MTPSQHRAERILGKESMNCATCHRPLPVHEFPGAIPERQAVFVVRDGQRIHVPPCPEPEPMRPNDMTPDGS